MICLICQTRKVAILGDMGELGKNEAEMHKDIGKYIANKNVDIIICVGKLSAYIYDGAAEILSDNTSGLFHFVSQKELIMALPQLLKYGDTILVKASHFMGFDNIVKLIMELT